MTVYLAGNDEEAVAVKRIIKRIVIICFVSLALFIALFAGDIIRTMCTHEQTLFSYVLWDIAGLMPRYHAVMDIPVERGGKTVPCKLYRRSCSPFLLLGPYPFKPDALPGKPRSDFFFIEREHVRGRCWDDYLNDRAFFRKWLWIASDLDPGEIDSIVPNYYFDVKRGEDPATGLVHFTCSANSAVEEETFRFSIPKHLIDALPECRGKPQSRNEWALILLGLYVLLRISVFVFCLLALAAGAVTAQIAMYLYGKEKVRQGIAAVVLYIPWMFLFSFFASAVNWTHWSSIPAVWLASLCAGIPHCFYLKSGGERLKNAAIFGIVSVVCLTSMQIGKAVLDLWGFDRIRL